MEEKILELLPEKSIELLILFVAVIILDAVFGMAKAAVKKDEKFDLKKSIQFLKTNLTPYGGAMVILGVLAMLVGEPIAYIFYVIVVPSIVAYLLDIVDKAKAIKNH